jgi:chemotaxis protein methyltransferase CheR
MSKGKAADTDEGAKPRGADPLFGRDGEPPSDIDIELRLLMEAIFLKYSYDFRNYTGASQKRRVRYALEQLRLPNVSALQERVLHDPTVFAQLLQYLTIPVSEMFRDPSYFLTLRQQVVPVLQTYPSVKVWVAGCSTGEEACIRWRSCCARKACSTAPRSTRPTSTRRRSTRRARASSRWRRCATTPPTTRSAGGQTGLLRLLHRRLRCCASSTRRCAPTSVFADHSLATDSVFAETQLVSCRNVLIYFNRALQDRALGLFHESLCHRGFLGLGAKESIDFSVLLHPLRHAGRVPSASTAKK